MKSIDIKTFTKSASRRRLVFMSFALLMGLVPLLPVPDFWITQLNYIGLFSLVAMGLVLLTGVGGLTSFGQAAFAGIGAYTSAYLSAKMGLSPWIGLAAGLVLTTCVALALGWLTLRMSGHYLPLATIAWCLALYYTMGNLAALGKYDGLLGVPAISILGVSFQPERRIFWLIWIAALGSAAALVNLLDSRPGRVMRALNVSRGGGSTMPESMGASTFQHKLMMFLIAALLASLSGWLFAHMQRSVNPSPFGIKFGIEYLFMAVLGGVGTVWGAFTGAALVKIGEDQLQVLMPMLLGTAGSFEVIVFGVALVLILKYAPDGLWPPIERLFARWMPPRRTTLPPQRKGGDKTVRLAVRERPTPGELLLSVKGLRKEFGGLVAVNNIGFDIRAGEIVGLIGPNGAGKSTTFHLISGVLPLTAGQVQLHGEEVTGLPAREMARRGLSRTFQHTKLVPDMTVLENVALGATMRAKSGILAAMLRRDRAQETRLLDEARRQLKRIGLAEQAVELAGNLSLGSQRLVEIARALASDPTLLMLDEPAAGLRHKEKESLSKVLRQLKDEGLSMLLVEHDMDFVMGLTDRIVVMEFGTQLMDGTPAQVQASPAVRAAYLGTDH